MADDAEELVDRDVAVREVNSLLGEEAVPVLTWVGGGEGGASVAVGVSIGSWKSRGGSGGVGAGWCLVAQRVVVGPQPATVVRRR